MHHPDEAPRDSRPRLVHMPGLDGLRGVAVVVVVLFHGGHLQGGYLGVDLFFVLSGFLITSLLLVESSATGTVELTRFWGRRARRLLPALGVMLAGVAAYAAFVAEPEELHRIRWDGVATMLYVANWREIFAGSDYWALFTAPSPLAHTWSLAIEEQFYLVWPLIVVAVAVVVRRRRDLGRGAPQRATESAPEAFARAMFAVCLVLAVAALGSQFWWQYVAGWNRVYFGTDTRAFALLCGAMTACVPVLRHGAASDLPPPGKPATFLRSALEAAGIIGAAVLVAAFVTMDGASTWARHGGLAICSVSGALVVAAVSHPCTGFLARVLAVRPLRWVGLISYGIYLYHWPIAVWLTSERVHLSGWPLLAVQVAVTLVVSMASYRLIEQPIRSGARWPRLRCLVVPATGFTAVGVLLLAATATSLPEAADVSQKALDQASHSTAVSGQKSVMIIGNSVAWYLGGDGFEKVRTEPPLRVVNNGRPNCQYPMTTRIRYSDNSLREADKIVSCDRRWVETAEAYRVDYAIFARNAVDPPSILVDGVFVGACSDAYEDYYRASLEADIGRLADAGVVTVLVTSPPSKVHFGQTPAYYRSYLKTAACGNDVLRQVARTNPADTRLVDLEARMCPTPTTCATSVDGTELRPDGTHFKGKGAQLVATWILADVGIEATPSD